MIEALIKNLGKRHISASQFSKLVKDKKLYYCATCKKLFDSENKLSKHIYTNNDHRYGQEKFQKEKWEFNKKCGLEPNADFMPKKNYPNKVMNAKMRLTLLHLLTVKAVLIRIKYRPTSTSV